MKDYFTEQKFLCKAHICLKGILKTYYMQEAWLKSQINDQNYVPFERNILDLF